MECELMLELLSYIGGRLCFLVLGEGSDQGS